MNISIISSPVNFKSMTIDGTSSILFRLVLVKPFTDNHGINEHFPRLFFLFLSFFFFFFFFFFYGRFISTIQRLAQVVTPFDRLMGVFKFARDS